MATKKYLVIGISGTTNSGKTTLTTMLKSAFPQVSTLCQDAYFKEPGDKTVPKLSNGFEDWDCLDAMHMNRMVNDVNDWISTHQDLKGQNILIIEGFLIFTYKPLINLFNKKYFIKVDYQSCAARRVHRVYDPPDPPGYFDAVVWPAYHKCLEEIKDQKDIEYVDGSESLENLKEKLIKDIKSLSQI